MLMVVKEEMESLKLREQRYFFFFSSGEAFVIFKVVLCFFLF